MEIVEHLVVHIEIVEENIFTYVGKELDVVIQNDVNLDVACGKKMDLLVGNMVESFRGVINVYLHDVVVVDMDMNLHVVVEMLKDMEVTTNVNFDDAIGLRVARRMNMYTIMSMDDIGLLLHILDMDSFTIDLMEDSYVMDLYAFIMVDLSLYIFNDRVGDLDIVANLVFMYEDDATDKL